MLAFVLSGAGNRGPLEVGALQALLEKGIVPDLVVGTSAGAINVAYLAAHGATQATVTAMGKLWSDVTTDTIYPENVLEIVWRLRSRSPSLYSNSGMRALLEGALPKTFKECQLPLFLTSTDLTTHRLFMWGNDVSAPLVDAVLASASVPGIHPPVTYKDLALVDGGVVANVAASVAIDQKATTIYVINAGYGGGKVAAPKGVLNVLGLTLSTMLSQSLLQDIDRAKQDPNVDLYHIHLPQFSDISFRDFRKGDEMIAAGYASTKAYLAAPPPAFVPAPAGAPAPAASPYGESVGGAQEYIPPYDR